MRVVLDTNVIYSALLNPRGRPAQVLRLALHGALVPLFDKRIQLEYEEVLRRRGFPPSVVHRTLKRLYRLGRKIRVRGRRPLDLPDPDDAPFVEVARAGKAEAIVTGNARHFPEAEIGVVVLTPRQLIDLLGD